MFSLRNFYSIVYKHLLEPIQLHYFYFSDAGSIHPRDLATCNNKKNTMDFALFYDQEPIYQRNLAKLWGTESNEAIGRWHSYVTTSHSGMIQTHPKLFLFANSEHSREKDDFLKNIYTYQDWYYFFHGFAALDWFRDIEYQPPIRKFERVFLSFNNLFIDTRSYRLNLIARLLDKNLQGKGFISISQDNTVGKIKNEIFSKDSLLSIESKKLIVKNMLPAPPRLIIDTENPHGALSADDNLETMCLGLFHVVTETIFYDEKLHLTEKIFKPIVARRPFVLVAAPGNLKYLKSYGFKTFDKWIDESYDDDTDNDVRIIKIVNEIERLCNLTADELDAMYTEMSDILDYNFDWFYNGFKKTIVNEMVDNLNRCIIHHNAGRPSFSQVNRSLIDFEQVKLTLGC